jgi:hypothetical protein
MKHQKLMLAAVVMAGSLPFMGSAQATPGSHVQSVPIEFTFDLNTTINCSNHGDEVNINGPIGLGSSAAAIWYQNNTKGTHQSNVYSGVVAATVTPAGGSVNLVKQPSKTNADGQYGSGGNPWIWYDADAGGTEYGPELIGRCVDPSHNVSKRFTGSFSVTSTLEQTITAIDCTNTNAAVHMKHTQKNPSVAGTLMFDNNVNKPTHPSSKAASLQVELQQNEAYSKETDIKAGMGNPLVYVATGDSADYYDATSAAALMNAGKGTKLGRCNQLF